MSLLELQGVCKGYGRGAHEQVVLRDVCLELDAGELAAIWGLRRSGRSTLLRIAAGIARADAGTVHFAGRDLFGRSGEQARSGIGYCQMILRPFEGAVVLEQLLTDQLTRGIAPARAAARAHDALARAGAEDCAARKPSELDGDDTVRVAIARALAREPQLLVIDEPTLGIDLLARDAILQLLRSLADDGIAVLMSVSETTGLAGADRALSLGGGELRGSLTPQLAAVVPLRRPA